MIDLRKHTYFRPLKNDDFLRLFISILTTKIGYWFTFIALFSIFVFEDDLGAVGIGVLALVQLVPTVVAGPVLSTAVDRFNRGKIILGTELASGVVVLLLIEIRELTLAYAVLFCLGLCSSVAAPAQKALVPQLIEDDDLSAANALVSGARSSAQLVGPAVAGSAVAIVDPAVLFAVDASSYFISAVLFVPLLGYDVPGRTGEPDPSITGDFVDGIKHVAVSPALLLGTAIAVLISLATASINAMLPFYIREVLTLSATAYGWLASATAIGAILASTIIGSGRLETSATLGSIVSMVVLGTALFGIATVHSLLFVGIALVVAAFATTSGFTYVTTHMQTATDDEKMGRVFGLFRSASSGSRIASIGLSSVLMAQLGSALVFGIIGVIVAFSGCIGYAILRTRYPNTIAVNNV
ncbi:MFS transporter [Natrinema salaciae]|uniref:Transmembrane secretion effector n=1 Tax=Natrinema salaciae TaxID=1186196 RepID=A0A1H9LE42_9EURY|nr:MFS transporter [Natrinema salaciae]SER09405.1 Transmembrane secretion effector [Natrinema salaciae]